MSDFDFDSVAQLRALQIRRPVPIAARAKVEIQPHAYVLAMVQMAAEDASMHAFACGPLGGRPQVEVIPDPRNVTAQAKLFEKLARILVPYIHACHRRGDFPQIILSSESAASKLAVISEAFRHAKRNKYRRTLARRLTYFIQRAALDGQQCLITIPGLLTRHWAYGISDVETQHPGVLLVWHRRRDDQDVYALGEKAERVPLGATTDPKFDNNDLEPHIRLFHQALDAHRSFGPTRESKQAVRAAVRRIQEDLTPIVTRIWTAIHQGVEIYRTERLPLLPELPEFIDRERAAFEFFMRYMDGGAIHRSP